MKQEAIDELLKTKSMLQFVRVLFRYGYGEFLKDRTKFPKKIVDHYEKITAGQGDFNCPIDKFR